MNHLPGDELIIYLKSLKAGERVIELENPSFLHRQGTVYINPTGNICVLWDKMPGEKGQMGTGVMGGTRRVSDVPNAYELKCLGRFV